MITLNHINKSFNDKSGKITILDDVSLSLPDYGFISLCGKSGSGKTTLLKMIAGKIKNYEGTILYDNVNVIKEKRQDKFFAKNVFYLKYNDNFFLSLKVKKALKFYLNKNEIVRAYEYIEKFSLKDLLDKKIGNLSSGELQKISICFALAKRAKITILDEPICNIDASSIEIFLEEIKLLSKDVLVIYVSHFERDIVKYYDMKIRLHEGKAIVEQKENVKIDEKIKKVENAKRKFSFLSSLYCETIKPKGVYILFRFILIVLILFQVTITLTSKITISDIYYNTLNNMSVNIIDGDVDNYNDYDCIKVKKLYSHKNPVGNVLHLPLALVNENNKVVDLKYFAKASDYCFDGYKDSIVDNEIIISDIVADNLKLSVGSVAYGQSSDLYKNSYGALEYKIKHIYPTNFYSKYKTLSEVPNDEYKYETIFISDELFDYFEETCLNGINGIYLNDDTRLITWKKEYDGTVTTTKLNDNEFYADFIFLNKLGYDFDFLFDSVGEKVNITLNYKDKSITKELIYAGFINFSQSLAVSDNLYQELIEYFVIQKGEIFNNTLKNTIDVKANDFKKFCYNELTSSVTINFTNSSIINEKDTIVKTQVSMLKDNSIYLYFFGVLFIIISMFGILKNEYKSYVMLREKNFTIANALCTNILIKIIFWLIVSLIIYGISLNIISIFINSL